MKTLSLRTISAGILSLFIVTAAHAANYKIDAAHSSVGFKVRHLGISTVSGQFGTFEGTVEYDPKNVAASKTEATIDVASVNTNNPKRDGHLKECDFFCIEKFQKMTFKTLSVTPGAGKKFKINGELSLHGVSKPVTLDAEFIGAAPGPDGKERVAFSAVGELNRKDFGLTWDKITEAGGVMVGAEVKISIEIEAVKE